MRIGKAFGTFFFLSALGVVLLLGSSAEAVSRAAAPNHVFLPLVQRNYLTFFDDFGNPASGWLVGDFGQHAFSYQGGEYEIAVHNPNWYAWAGPPNVLLDSAGYTVEADARWASASTGRYGLMFDRIDTTHFWMFTTNTATRPSGRWALIRASDAGWTTIQGWTDSAAILIDGSPNHLRVDRTSNNMTLWVNGTAVTSNNDATYAGSPRRVAVFAHNTTQEAIAARFDNVRVAGATSSAAAASVGADQAFAASDGGAVVIGQ